MARDEAVRRSVSGRINPINPINPINSIDLIELVELFDLIDLVISIHRVKPGSGTATRESIQYFTEPFIS